MQETFLTKLLIENNTKMLEAYYKCYFDERTVFVSKVWV